MSETEIDYSYFVNVLSSRRRHAISRELTRRLNYATKESISMGEGMPNEETFPFESMTFSLKDGTTVKLNEKELNTALQYNQTQGFPPLLKTLEDFTKFVHNPPNWDRSQILVTVGSQDAISMAIDMSLTEGDTILVQNPLYAGVEGVLKYYKPVMIPLGQDQDGIIPELMEQVLFDWKTKCDEDTSYKMPKLLYVNPTASNPTGTTIPLERRKEIYKICCKYNIVIMEDDPYYFLHFQDSTTPSFLSMDTEGRVLRMDSFSKILCPGLRIGWVTGPKPLVQKISLHVETAYLHASTLSQLVINSLFTHWGFQAFLDRLDEMRNYYKVRRDITLQAMEKHLKGLCEWTIPSGGMFVWIKVKGISDVYDMLMTRGLKKMITFVPGHAFMADPTQACNYLRASFSKASPVQIDMAMKLLAELIVEEKELLNQKLNNLT